MQAIETILSNAEIRRALSVAWLESQPGPTGGHEQGGFILQTESGLLRVVRWPKGRGNSIEVPPHPNCRIGGLEIVASFHTHPNTGPEYLQQPSETDRRAVKGDPDLKAGRYVGELVISAAVLYLVNPDGTFVEVGGTRAVLES